MEPTAARAHAHDDTPHEDHSVCIAATWADYQRHLKLRGDSARPRLTYDAGVLEIMAPSENHEQIAAALEHLVAAYCDERGIDYTALRSWTLKSKALGKGLEPDACFAFGAVRKRSVPDLAIEVVWTAGGKDKLPLYLALGVREVWVWRRGVIVAYLRRAKRYQPARRSELLEGVDLDELVACVGEPTTSAAVRRFRAHLRR